MGRADVVGAPTATAEENSFLKDGEVQLPGIPKYAELLLAHGYGLDSEKNVMLLSSLMELENAEFSRLDLLKLHRVWSFLCRLERTGVAELPALVSLDAGQGGDHDDFGVHHRTGAPMYFAPHRNLLRRLCGWLENISPEPVESDSPPEDDGRSGDGGSDEDLPASPQDSVASFQRQQRTPRSASSHGPHDRLATVLGQCLRLGEAERAAALALWHGDLDLCVHLLCAAVGFLRRGPAAQEATAGVTMMLSVPGDATDSERAEYADAVELVAACVAGYPEHSPPTSKDGAASRWRVTTQRMLVRLQRLARLPTHSRAQGAGYLQAICHFLLVNESANGRTRRSELYSAFLKAPHEAGALAVSDTLAFAATYLDGAALQQCLRALHAPRPPTTTSACHFTCLEAFCATGLSTCGQALLLRYLKQSGDAVTVALLAARCITEPGLFANQSLLPLPSGSSYPSLAQPPLAGGGRVPAAALSAVAASLSSMHQQRLLQREEAEKWRSKWAAAAIQLLRLRLSETQRKTEVIGRARLDLALARRLLALRQWQAAPVGGALALSGQALLHQTLLALLRTRTSVSLAIGDHSSVGQSLFGNTAATQAPAAPSAAMRLSEQQREEAATFDATQQLAAAVLSLSLAEEARRTGQPRPALLALDGHAGVCRVSLLCRQCRRPVGGSSAERDAAASGASPNAANAARGDGDAEATDSGALVDAAATEVGGASGDNEAMRVLLSLGQCSGCRASLPACFVCDLPLAMPRARRPVPLPGRQLRDAGREDLSVSLCQRCGHGGHPDCLRALRRYCQPLPRAWQRYSDRRRSFRGPRAPSRDADSDRDAASAGAFDSPSDSDDGLSLAGEDLRSEIDTVRSGRSEDDSVADAGSDGDAWLDSEGDDSWATAADDRSAGGVSTGSRRARRPFSGGDDDETDDRADTSTDEDEDEDEDERLWPSPPLSSPPPAVATGLPLAVAPRPRDRKRSVSSAAAASHTSRLSTQPARRLRSDDAGPLLVPSRPRRVSTSFLLCAWYLSFLNPLDCTVRGRWLRVRLHVPALSLEPT